MRQFFPSTVVLLLACSGPTSPKATASLGPTNEYTRVEGIVYNSAGQPLPSATVLVEAKSSGTNTYFLNPVLTGTDGRFSQLIARIDKLPERVDTVTASVSVYPKEAPRNEDGSPQITVVAALLRFAASVPSAPTTRVEVRVPNP
jgi:hypothetical protein